MKRFGGPTIATATLMTKDDVQNVIDMVVTNPTVDKLIFVETRKSKNVERKVFPCYPIALVKVEDDEFFTISVVQSHGHQHMFGIAKLPVDDMGIKYRFWDFPPTEDLMDVDPLPEAPAEEPAKDDEEVPPQ